MAKTIRLKIDGTDVEVEAGKMILDAAETTGVKIPTLCHDPRLVPFGACRLCVVQQKGMKELQLACFTPARDGMEIITQSPEVTESRRLQLQLILLNHPMICPRCEKEGECLLQNLVYEYGVEETQFPWEKFLTPADNVSPLIQRDPDKCILCGRCVRICDEVQGVGELSFAERGIRTSIDTDFHRPLDCEFCGQCLDTCPVAAITSDSFDYSSKAWELKETTAPCPYCGCGCLLTIGSKEGKVKRVFSDPAAGPSDGNLCVKGRFGWDFIDHPERVKNPLLKVNGEFRETSWDEALRFVAAEFERIKHLSGPNAIAGILSSRLTNEEYYLSKILFNEALATGQVVLAGNGADKGLTEGLSKTLGIAASTNSIQELRNSDCILIIGVDPAETHPIVKNEIHLAIRKNKAQLVVVGSYDIGLSRTTQVSPLSPPAILLLGKPGIEIPLLNGITQTILKEGLENKGFIEKKTEGIEILRKTLTDPGIEMYGALSVTMKKNLEKAARAFSQAKRGMILVGTGAWSHLPQKEIAIAASNLALVTGQLGKESSGILILQEKCNSQGAIDQGILSNGGPGDLLNKIEEGEVKAIYMIGEDSVAKAPHPDRLKMAFEKLQLLVVQDLFMTETAKMAHVVLPAASFVEKKGTYTNLERRVQKLNPMRSPAYGSKPDFDIFLHLLRTLEWPISTDTPEAVFEEISRQNQNYQGIRYGEQWPKGSPYLYSNGFPNERAKFISVENPRASTLSKEINDYPLLLIQKPSLFRSGILGLKSENLEMLQKEPLLEINPEDAGSLGIEDGEMIRILGPAGNTAKMKIKFSRRPVQGVLLTAYPCSFIEEKGIASVKVEKLTPR
jgi:NADH-quinone oxidoreductase subunit G